jgi:pyrimidine-specific ribonucleoside hydrolase
MGGKMKKKIKLLIFVLCVLLMQAAALKLKGHTYRVPLIIDTDMALDDARALVMLFNADVADVLLMVTSDGAVSPETGRRNLKKFLGGSGGAIFQKSRSIKIAVGRELHKKSPPWRKWSENIFSFAGSFTPGKKESAKPAAQAIVETLRAAEDANVYLCLGPMTNLADALHINGSIKDKISRVIYYGTPPGAVKTDWNTARDLASAQKVFDSGIKIMTLSNPEIENLKFDTSFFDQIKALNTPASCFMVELHSSPIIEKLLSESHFRLWDDITIIYLNRPDLFGFSQKGANIFEVNHYRGPEVYQEYIKLLGYAADSHLLEREVVVLDVFPQAPALFKGDVEPFVKKIIEKHGLEEWKACVLTNELHRHLGIYSIIGAKMGIWAREILTAPIDSLKVFSFAGNKPPLSCMNDGLQVSTGASLGRGTIKIAPLPHSPAAEFIYGDQRLILRLKEEIVLRIKKDIQAAIKKYGNLSPEYFAHVRKLSLDYWQNLNRTAIFLREAN